jgi:uncharacterized membrane protein YkvA (DUF1232 family)
MGVLERLRSLRAELRRHVRVYRLVLRDPRTPRLARWLLGAALLYALSPVDLIPDVVPGLGHLDDAILVPLLAYLALRLIPPQVLADARAEDAA